MAAQVHRTCDTGIWSRRLDDEFSHKLEPANFYSDAESKWDRGIARNREEARIQRRSVDVRLLDLPRNRDADLFAKKRFEP